MIDLEIERGALYEAIVSMDHSGFVSVNQVQALAGLVGQGLVDKSRTNRIAVMNYLIGDAVYDVFGVKFESFKNMSSAIATMLIDMLLTPGSLPWKLSDYGRELLEAAENTVKAYAAV